MRTGLQHKEGTVVSFEQIVPVSRGKSDTTQVCAEDLFFEHGDFLMNVFLKNLPEQDALDAFQTLYLNIVMNGIPENTTNIRGYLYRAATNDIIDFKRKSSTYQKNIHNYSQHLRNSKSNNDPAEKLMRFSQLMKTFERIGKHLSPSVEQVFIQKYQHNLDHHEIAEKLNLKKGTVDRYLSVGTKQIQELHDQFFGDADEHI